MVEDGEGEKSENPNLRARTPGTAWLQKGRVRLATRSVRTTRAISKRTDLRDERRRAVKHSLYSVQ